MKQKLIREWHTSIRRITSRSSCKLVSVRFLGVVYCCLLALERCHGDDIDEEAMALMQIAINTHKSDWERLKHVQAEGRLEFLSADRTVFWVCTTSFEVSEHELWMKITNETVEPPNSRSYQEVELVADGQIIAATNRSERIKPAGCETEIVKDDITGFQIRTGCHQVDPRKIIVPSFLRGDALSGYRKRKAIVRFRQESSGGTKRQVEVMESKSVQRFDFSPEPSSRLIQYSIAPVNDEPTWIYRYTYDATGDDVFPRTITVDLMDYPDRKGLHSCKLQIEKIVPKASGLPFNLSRLQFCENSRVLDHRPGGETSVRNFSPSAIKSMPEATIDEQVVSLPDRYQIPDRQPLLRRERRLPWLLIAINSTVVVAVVAYLWKKRLWRQ